MPICVECGSSVSEIYRQFSKGSIRLTRCNNCDNIADKYIEYELVLIFIDLILHKSQVYRHILFNRISYVKTWFDVTLLKFTFFFLFFDSYLKWFIWTKLDSDLLSDTSSFAYSNESYFSTIIDSLTYILLSSDSLILSLYNSVSAIATFKTSAIIKEPIIIDYELCNHYNWLSNIFGINIECNSVITVLQISSITFFEYLCYVAGILLFMRIWQHLNHVKHLKYNYVVMALIISSFAKVAVLLLFVWPEYSQHHSFALVISLFVVSSHVVALRLFMNNKTEMAILSVLSGVMAKALFHTILRYLAVKLPMILI